jgi:hypothetical protein
MMRDRMYRICTQSCYLLPSVEDVYLEDRGGKTALQNLSLYITYTRIIKKKLCMCSLVAREQINQFAPNLHPYSLRPERDFRKSKLQKNCFEFESGEGGSCRSGTKHDRRMVPRPKLFVSKRKLQRHRSQPRETVLGSCPGKGISCSSENKHDIRMTPKSKFLFRK